MKEFTVIGLTNNSDAIPHLLGVKGDETYELYTSTQDGDFYVKRYADGSRGTELVRLVSNETAAQLEKQVCAMIDDIAAGIPNVQIPDLQKISANIEHMSVEVTARAAQTAATIHTAMAGVRAIHDI